MSQWQGSDVLPKTIVFAYEHQLFDAHLARALEPLPTFPSQGGGSKRLLVPVGFYDRKVRNIGPFLFTAQNLPAKLIVKLLQAGSCPRHLDEDGRGRGQKSLDSAQFDIKGRYMAAGVFEELQSDPLGARQLTGRQNGEVRRHVGQRWMKLPPQLFDEFADRIADVRHQRIAWTGHDYRTKL